MSGVISFNASELLISTSEHGDRERHIQWVTFSIVLKALDIVYKLIAALRQRLRHLMSSKEDCREHQCNSNLVLLSSKLYLTIAEYFDTQSNVQQVHFSIQ